MCSQTAYGHPSSRLKDLVFAKDGFRTVREVYRERALLGKINRK
jgi:hypothetical protein